MAFGRWFFSIGALTLKQRRGEPVRLLFVCSRRGLGCGAKRSRGRFRRAVNPLRHARPVCGWLPVSISGCSSVCGQLLKSTPQTIVFCSCFDSSQARKTVRWGRFRGLELAPVFAVKPGFVCARSSPGRRRGCLNRRFCDLRAAFRQAFRACLRSGFRLPPAARNLLFFAPALIAAKPEKSCDGGVFGAFYSLSKRE